MPQHVRGEQPELLPREVAAGPGELGTGDVAPGLQPGLEILDRREHEEVAALVVLPAPRTDAGHHIIGELQFVHYDPSKCRPLTRERRTRPVPALGWYSGKAEVSSSTSAANPATAWLRPAW